MAFANPGARAYQTQSILTASPGQLVLLMYDGCLRFMAQARAGFALPEDNPRRIETIHTALLRAQAILSELRANLDALFAKLAAPGYANPDDAVPCLDGRPSQTHIDADTRSPAQRTHDALLALARATAAAGNLGQHNGLPVTIVATTSLAELSAAAGFAHTGGGSLLPFPTLIRMAASGGHPYRLLFDNP